MAMVPPEYLPVSDRANSIVGKDGKICLEADSIQKEVDYDHVDELIHFRKSQFQTTHVAAVIIKDVDYNRISADRLVELLEGCETPKFDFKIWKKQYTQEAFALIQMVEKRAKIALKMYDFCLAPEQLLSLKPALFIGATGNFSTIVEDETVLALIGREHEKIIVVPAFHSPEAIRDAFKLVSTNEQDQIVMIKLSDDLFTQFINLIGARMVDDKLVQENDSEGFIVGNKNDVNICRLLRDYSVVFERASGMIAKEDEADEWKWSLTISNMKRKLPENNSSPDTRQPGIISNDPSIQSPEAIRDAFKLVSTNEQDEAVLINLSDDMFTQFINLIGARMVDDKLVLENGSEGFTVANESGIGDYMIYYELTHGIIIRTGQGDMKWTMLIAKMGDSDDEGETESGEDG